jgi:hypothetical protein
MPRTSRRTPQVPRTFAEPRTRTLTVLGQDPTLADKRGVVTVQITIPCERLAAGPQGARLHVIDSDASTGTLYRPLALDTDRFRDETDPDRLVRSRAFHAQNVYGIAMETLGRFARALGRRVPWSILFGYFPSTESGGKSRPETIFTCLSHDVVAHETTHALLDGLRPSEIEVLRRSALSLQFHAMSVLRGSACRCRRSSGGACRWAGARRRR